MRVQQRKRISVINSDQQKEIYCTVFDIVIATLQMEGKDLPRVYMNVLFFRSSKCGCTSDGMYVDVVPF